MNYREKIQCIVECAVKEVLDGDICIHKKINQLYHETKDRDAVVLFLDEIMQAIRYSDDNWKVFSFIERVMARKIKLKARDHYPSLVGLQNKVDNHIIKQSI